MQQGLNISIRIMLLTTLSLTLQSGKGTNVLHASPIVAPSSSGVNLVVTPLQSKFNLSDTVLVTLAIVNTSDKSISYEERGFPLKEFTVSVTDSSNQQIPLTRYGRLVHNQQLPNAVYRNVIREIAPGYEGKYHFWLNRQYDMTFPGTYYVTISRSFTNDRGQSVSLESARTPITLIEPVNIFNKNDNNLEVPTFQKITGSMLNPTQ